jgi:glycosyltransferase involved in cell wall biosynthesis
MMSLSVAVVIATKGRPQEVLNLLDVLASQTTPPELIVVSACSQSDIGTDHIRAENVKVILGSPGLPAQRNRALSRIQGKYDVVVFFDDDFIPSRFWIERIRSLFATQLDVGTASGRVLVDGVKSGGLPWSYGQSLVDEADASDKMATPSNYGTQPNSPYGCNMAFRLKTIEGMVFDERLALYGWLEDLDFGLRAATRGRMISTDLVWGVHLGVRGGRDSGLRFGYSQVVNPWYLMNKKIIRRLDACVRIGRGTAGNVLLSFSQKSDVDRRGRLKGNLIGIKDILLGKWAPERIVEL